jgi:hypothetical protein
VSHHCGLMLTDVSYVDEKCFLWPHVQFAVGDGVE